MTMNAMVKYLNIEGFDAIKEYIPEKKHYEFTVVNNKGRIKVKYFTYPSDVSDTERTRIQKEFLDDIIREFKCEDYIINDIGSTKDIPSLYPNMFVIPGRCNGKTMMLNAWIKQQLNAIYGPGNKFHTTPKIKDVIFNDPATIVFWADGTKTVVKTQEGDKYDPEKGLAMAISKKALGNNHEYYNIFKKWLKKYERQEIEKEKSAIETLASFIDIKDIGGTVRDALIKGLNCENAAIRDTVGKTMAKLINDVTTDDRKGFWTRIYDVQGNMTKFECSKCNNIVWTSGDSDNYPSVCANCNSEMHVPGHLELENGVPVKKEAKDEQNA